MSDAAIKLTENMVLTEDILKAIHKQILDGKTETSLTLPREADLKTEMDKKIAALMLDSKKSADNLKKELDKVKLNISQFAKNLDIEKRIRKLDNFNGKDKDDIVSAFQQFNENHFILIDKFYSGLDSLEKNYLLQDKRFTEILNAYGLYSIKSNNDLRTKVDGTLTSSLETMNTTLDQQKNHNHDGKYAPVQHTHDEYSRQVTRHFHRNLGGAHEIYNVNVSIPFGGKMLQSGTSPWSSDNTIYTCPEDAIYQFQIYFTGCSNSSNNCIKSVLNNKDHKNNIQYINSNWSSHHILYCDEMKKNDKLSFQVISTNLIIINYYQIFTVVTYWPK
ncbi:hypothetical protein [Silvanigrella aquatica]|uniref:C1q domain-containing protein n=1 Tax=Silvanigrella aquatica TaxID=1915309 RepID=A0A1L4D164_9BACT|nr:hypothetical protein [Silvanigrella aquatica]APJ03936.1 hypothetical protein AXG55_08470 [Silvanigrella aquatica]